jgi:DNA-binding response OmpR family regulator
VRVLLVEDDDMVVDALVPALRRRGFTVDRLADGTDVLDRLTGMDVVLLDLRLPDTDGVTLARQIRAISDVAIIVVSALGDVADRILALHAGADDYLVKPYDVGELVARVYAVLRRGTGAHGPIGTSAEVIRVGDVEIHLGRHQVLVDDETVSLSRREFQLLVLVAQARGAVCTRERILTEIWASSSAELTMMLEEHVATVRAKLRRAWVLEAVGGVGYRLGRPTAARLG